VCRNAHKLERQKFMKTEVTNISGATVYFGWIPPHGRRLHNGQKVDLHGDLRTNLAGGRNRYSQKTSLTAMDYDINHHRALVCTAEENCHSDSSHFASSLTA